MLICSIDKQEKYLWGEYLEISVDWGGWLLSDLVGDNGGKSSSTKINIFKHETYPKKGDKHKINKNSYYKSKTCSASACCEAR